MRAVARILSWCVLLRFLMVPIMADADVLNAVRRRGKLRVAADPVTMPWYGYDALQGRYTGFEYELIELVARQLGEGIEVELVPAVWESLPNVVKSGRADVLWNAWFLPDSDTRGLWSRCYFKTSLAILYRKSSQGPLSLASLSRSKLLIYPDEKAVKVMEMLGVTGYRSSDQDWRFAEFVSRRKVDLAIIDKPAALYMAKRSHDVKVDSRLLEQQSAGCYSAMVAPGADTLLAELNAAIAKVEPIKKEILRKYGIEE